MFIILTRRQELTRDCRLLFHFNDLENYAPEFCNLCSYKFMKANFGLNVLNDF